MDNIVGPLCVESWIEVPLTFCSISWAVGWSQCNMIYRGRIHDKWTEIGEKASVIRDALGSAHAFSIFMDETTEFIKNTIGVQGEEYEEDILGPEVDVELNRLNTKWQKLSEELMGENMRAKEVINDQQSIAQIVGHSDVKKMGQPRIDLVKKASLCISLLHTHTYSLQIYPSNST